MTAATSSSTEDSDQGIATFAGGCFWCVEPAFAQLEGIESLTVGYTGGDVPNPSYMQVETTDTGHYEALQLKFDSNKISYEKLLDTFWRQIDPTDAGGQFADRGHLYMTAIFYHSPEQKRLAEESREKLDKAGIYSAPIVTKILPAKEFYPAEDYHQQYYKKNPIGYKMYAWGSGRKSYLQEIWGKQHK